MSFGNKNADPKKIYSLLERPPVKECGGKLDKDGVDSYWGESLTIQSEAESANIPKIMEKYTKTGIVDVHVRENLQYGDVSEIPDFHAAMNEVSRAHSLFETLDAQIRSRFGNDPAKMIDFLHDEKNYDEAYKLGLVNGKKVKETKVEPPAAKPMEPQKEAPKSTP